MDDPEFKALQSQFSGMFSAIREGSSHPASPHGSPDRWLSETCRKPPFTETRPVGSPEPPALVQILEAERTDQMAADGATFRLSNERRLDMGRLKFSAMGGRNTLTGCTATNGWTVLPQVLPCVTRRLAPSTHLHCLPAPDYVATDAVGDRPARGTVGVCVSDASRRGAGA
jgi:hypothetical protein